MAGHVDTGIKRESAPPGTRAHFLFNRGENSVSTGCRELEFEDYMKLHSASYNFYGNKIINLHLWV
jgi:hypothetical protein